MRITFDRDVRAAVGGWDLFDQHLPTLPVLDPGTLVMEVKFTEFLPQTLRELLPPKAQEWTAVSKYVLCCRQNGLLPRQFRLAGLNQCERNNAMSVKDFIKKSVLENFSPYNVPQMAAALLAAVLLGALIYWVYQRFYAGVLFPAVLQ